MIRLITTDRLLWLLQMLLFATAIMITVMLLAFPQQDTSSPETSCEWVYTYPDGQEVTARRTECDESSFITNLAYAYMNFLLFTGFGAIIFCLRRIATYLRERG